MQRDEIIAEVRKIREEIAREHGYDLHAISEAMKKVSIPPGSQLVKLAPKRLPKRDTASKERKSA